MRLEFYADLPIYITSRKRNGCDEYVIINRNVPGGWSDSELRENGLLIEFYTTEVDDAIDLFMLSVEAYITDKKKSMPALYAHLEAHVFLGKPTELRRSFSDEEFSDDLMQILYTRHEPTWKRVLCAAWRGSDYATGFRVAARLLRCTDGRMYSPKSEASASVL